MNLLEKLISKIINNFPVTVLEWLETKIHQTLFMKMNINHCRQIDYYLPWRPSRGDLENYKKAISDFDRKCRILILGIMPELGDLIVPMGFKVSVVAEGKFDIILFDAVSNMIEAEEEFLNKIKNLLSPGGIFIVRLHFFDEALSELTAKEILEKSINILDDELAIGAMSRRIPDKFSDFGKTIEFMEEAKRAAKGKKRRKMMIFKALNLILKRKGARRPISKIQLENRLSKFFDIIDVKIAGDYPDSKFYPIYVMRMRT
jgi:SAM-dependent methyltransferase